MRLRALPAVDRVLATLEKELGPSRLLTNAVRTAVDAARQRVRAGEPSPGIEQVAEEARRLIAEHERSLLRPVINATGVLIHTNLGRVPLGTKQLDAIATIASGYSNLEYDLNSGQRGNRYSHAAALITAVTGAEAALVVNNNAAAVLLCLAALCKDKEVVVSRGELIEIGGEFRIPDVMGASGARLVEVGTTNRTHLADYERAISPDTAAIMKVHPSNYRVVGFTASVSAKELARVARGRGVLFLHDLGSGFVGAPDENELTRNEPATDVAIEDGADLVTFSGDKLLGGPQAGVIAGRRDLIDKLARHPLLRALRVDKMTLAALEATLGAYLSGTAAELPLWQMTLQSGEDLERRARTVVAGISATVGEAAKVEAITTHGLAGGGSAPGTELASWGIAVTHQEKSAGHLEKELRLADTPVVGRIEDDRLVLDLRTVHPDHDGPLAEILATVLSD